MGALWQRALAASCIWLIASCDDDRRSVTPYHTGPTLPDFVPAGERDAAGDDAGSASDGGQGAGGGGDGGDDAGMDAGRDAAGPSDAGRDAAADAGRDAGRDAGTLVCHSWTPVEAGRCGGPFCNQTEGQLRTDLLANEMSSGRTAACRDNDEVTAMCSLESIRDVTMCARSSGANEDSTRQCARAALPQLSTDCVECYVDAAVCAAQRCAGDCLAGDSVACDACQISSGCAGTLYLCTGFVDPDPP
jgi:hypothetical protein